jgi:ATP-dependent helicase HrpB
VNGLPINQILEKLIYELENNNNVILVAEPGAGKTTRVPLALLEHPALNQKKIIMLQPRRIAARSSAQFIAASLKETLGATVGLRVRGESKIGPKTRLEIVTEGVLTRILQSDQELEDVGLVIFDEFHERNIQADLGLALVLEIQKSLRPDLKILVMSATLDLQSIVNILNTTAVVSCPGKSYPLEIKYIDNKIEGHWDNAFTKLCLKAFKEAAGDILAFLPGRAEIERVKVKLSQELDNVNISGLYSELSLEQQQLALLPDKSGRRRIILATNIAETSLTIDGIRIVVDSGLTKQAVFDPAKGMGSLETVMISKASAKQRAGRAARQDSGLCYRLWTAKQQQELKDYAVPEILQSDLSSLILELAAWGQSEPIHFAFINQPLLSAVDLALQSLSEIGALDSDSRITPKGKKMLTLACHPRIANMLIMASELGQSDLAAKIAAIVEERSVLQDSLLDSEISSRLSIFYDNSHHKKHRIQLEYQRLKRIFEAEENNEEIDVSAGVLTAFIFPERIAKCRDKNSNKFLMKNGAGCSLPENSPLKRFDFLAVAHLDAYGPNARIKVCEPITESEIRKFFSDSITKENICFWDENSSRVVQTEQERLGAIILSSKEIHLETERAQEILLSQIKLKGIDFLNLDESAQDLIKRNQWLRSYNQKLPDLSNEYLISTLEIWLKPFLAGVYSLKELRKLNFHQIFSSLFSWQELRELEIEAPQTFELPTGRHATIDYSSPAGPKLSVRIQEVFGLKHNPRIGDSKVGLIFELLSPAGRPIQLTQDLASFWQGSYEQVRKEMQGRYPKHYWPLDPANSVATAKTKNAMKRN